MKASKRALWRGRWLVYAAGFVMLFLGLLTGVRQLNAWAAVGTNQQINYQGRLLTSTGAVVADGNYNMEFKIYQDGDGVLGGGDESLKWTETRSGSNKVLVRNGYFSIYLGSVTAFGNSVDWNQDTLWLSVNIGGTGSPSWDGEMSPFTRFSSSPYALNSARLGGLDSTQYVRLGQGVQTDSSTTNPAIFVNKTNLSGSPNILQLQKAGSDVFLVNNSGLATAAGGLTVTTGQNFTVNSDTFTDLTGNGLRVSSNALTLQTTASADALSSTTSSGSGLEVLAGGLTLLQGCSDTQILKWNEASDVWACSSDLNNTDPSQLTTGSGAVTLASAASTNITISPGSGTLIVNASTLQRTAAGTTTLNLVDSSNTILAVTNSGAGVASITAEGSITSGAGLTGQISLTTPAGRPGILFGQDSTNITDLVNTATGELTIRPRAGGTTPSTKVIIQGGVSQGTTDLFQIQNSSTSVLAAFDSAGKLVFNGDTNLYRSAIDTLKTDDSFQSGTLKSTGSTLSVAVDGVALDDPTDNLLSRSGASNLSNASIVSGAVTRTDLGGGKWRYVSTGGVTATARLYVNLADLTSGATYASSVYYENKSAGSMSIDWNDQGNSATTAASGRLTTVASRATYDSTYRFLDINLPVGMTVDLYYPQVEFKNAVTAYTPTSRAAGDSLFWGNSTNLGKVLLQNAIDSTTAFQIQNAAGTSNLLVADTTTNRIGIGKAPTTYALEVAGIISGSSDVRANSGGSNQIVLSQASSLPTIFFGQNSDTLIQRSAAGTLTVQGNGGSTWTTLALKSVASQSADLLQLLTSGGNALTAFDSAGKLQFADGIGGASDTNLYRSAASTLKTDGALDVTGLTRVGTNFATAINSAGLIIGQNAVGQGIEFVGVTSGSGYGHRITEYDTGAGSTNLMIVGRSNSSTFTPALSVNSGGRIGIGTATTATPTSALQLASDAGTNVSGLTFGSTGDTNLYRSAADTLKTDDAFLATGIIQSAAALTALNPANTSANVSLDFNSNVPRIRYGGAGAGSANGFQIQGTGNDVKLNLTDAGQLILPKNGSAAGLVIGSDTNLYRSNTDQLTTDDSLVLNAGDAGYLKMTGSSSNSNYLSSIAGTFNIANNAYYNGTAWVYDTTAAAGDFQLNGGGLNFFTAASGTAGATPTFGSVLNITNNGDTVFKNRNNSNTALQIQAATATGEVMFKVDTLNKRVSLGTGSVAADATVLILDNVTNANLPSASSTINGAMIYDSTNNKFKCVVNGAWVDCDTTGAGSSDPSLLTTGSGAVTLASAAGTNLTLTAGSGTMIVNASTLQRTASGTTNLNLVDSSDTTLSLTNSGTGNANLTVDGNVGIGLGGATPTSKLMIQTSSTTPSAFAILNSSGVTVDRVNNAVNANLVSNPSMEVNINGWSAKGAATVSYDNTASNAKYDSGTLKMVNTAANDGAKFSVPLTPNTTYSMTFWAKTSSGTTTAILGRQENGTDVETSCSSFSVTTTWTQFSCSNFTTGSTINGTANIYIRQTVAGTPTIYVDGVTLVQATSGLTFDAGGQNFDIQSLGSTVTLNGNATGELQPWRLNPNTLPANREGAASVTSNGFIYSIGGTDGTAAQKTVQYASMNADGSTGSWSTTTAMANGSYDMVRQYPAAVTANGYVYVIGGWDSIASTATSTVAYAKLNADGTVGSWYCQGSGQYNACSNGNPVNANNLPFAIVGGAAVASNGYVYVMGGCDDMSCTNKYNAVYYAKLNADGSTGAWLTSTKTLSEARGFLTAAFENGYLVGMGGMGTTGGTSASTTVDKAQINASTGDLVANFSTTGMTQLPAGLQQHSSTIANGYIYAIGGSNGAASPARQSTVYYSKLKADGSNGIWQTNANALPAGRAGASTATANGYIYAIGGCGLTTAGTCGTNQTSTVYYASTARVMVGGTLDLVGLTSQSIADAGGGGAIIAGTGRFVGDLKVDGFADFNNGISVDNGINVNAVSATTGQTIFNINNMNSNSIFSVRYMNTNFGSLTTGGAFIQKNSYWGEEFNNGHNVNCAVPATAGNGVNSYSRGDNGNAGTATACTAVGANIGGGELNFSHLQGTAFAGCTAATVANAPNGVERITATSTTTANARSVCVENLAATTTTSNKIITATNLPVMTMKIKPSTLVASNSKAFIVAGMSTGDSANGAGNNFPNTGLFFTNCADVASGVPATCSNNNWFAMATSGGALVGTVQVCPVTMTTTQFAYLRIEVRATNEVRFYIDADTSNGINEVECGSGISSAVSTSAMTPWLEAAFTTNTATTTALDVDYIRLWQDDNVPVESMTDTTTAPNGDQLVTEAPLQADSVSTTEPEAQSGFFSFNAASSEDTVFNRDVYIRGTLFADKIKANQIDGLEIWTNSIASLQQKLDAANRTNATPLIQSVDGKVDENDKPGTSINLSDIQAVRLLVLAQLESRGGLLVNGDATFNGKATFAQLAQFNGDVSFGKQPLFNSDAGGTAVIKKGARRVEIKFSQEYDQKPVVTVNLMSDEDDPELQDQFWASDYRYVVQKVSTKNFYIMLNKPAEQDLQLNWLATAINNAKISQSTETGQ